LATVIDCHTKMVVGYAMDENYKTPLVEAALRHAAGRVSLRRTQSSTPIVSMCGPVFPGFLTRTAMDTPGCWCQVLPGALTRTSD
jgi:hypothetical protein